MPTLLVVDDVAADRVLVSGIASKWPGCIVIQADSGKSALAKIEVHLPDIILTDMHMPEMDGLELVSAVKNEFPNMPVILMTALGSEEIASKALRCGAASYVPKHRLAADLVSTLHQVHSTAQMARSQSRLMHYLRDSTLSFDLTNDPALLMSCVNELLAILRCLPLGDEAERLRVGIALQEALNNACFHGNLELTEEEYQSDEFAEIVAARMWTAPYVNRRIFLQAVISRTRAEFVIRDQGRGFNSDMLGDDDDASSSNIRQGRGIRLMRSSMNSVEFSETGNEVRMIRTAVAVDDDPGVD